MDGAGYYLLLPGKSVRPAASTGEALATCVEGRNRFVAFDTISCDDWTADVSTIFIIADHSFGLGGPPELFEKMIFGGPRSDQEYLRRYATYESSRSNPQKASP